MEHVIYKRRINKQVFTTEMYLDIIENAQFLAIIVPHPHRSNLVLRGFSAISRLPDRCPHSTEMPNDQRSFSQYTAALGLHGQMGNSPGNIRRRLS